MKIAVYPGSFDPMTLGHIDIIRRSLKIFDQVILLLAINPNKRTFFTAKERLAMMQEIVKPFGDQVRVDSTDGLSVTYAKEKGAIALVRGLRAVPDFEYENEIAGANEFINKNIETIFFISRNNSSFISSSMIKEMFKQGVDITTLVPPIVLTYLQKTNNPLP
jgi:pantetheine-phosphate adenylyltransferase